MSGPTDTVTLVSPEGKATDVPASEADLWISKGFTGESPEARAARVGRQAELDTSSPITAGVGAVGRGLTLGLSDVAARAIGGDSARRELETAREAHPTLSTGLELAGAVAPAVLTGGESIAAKMAAATPIGRAAQAGRAIADLGEGAGALGKIGYKALGGAAEGAIIGAGQGVSELALDDKPLTWEHAVSTLSSNALFGGAIGGGIGVVAGSLEHGLGKAKAALDSAMAERAGAPAVAEDLASLDARGLRAARASELERIEAERVPARKQLADEIGEFREDLKAKKIWLATKDADTREIREIGKLSIEADKTLDRTLRNPIALAENPQRALGALQQQENSLQKLIGKSETLRASFGADASGDRIAALDAAPGALERNRALQSKIKELVAEPKSTRLSALDDAKDALMAPKPKGLLGELDAGTVAGGFLGHHLGAGAGAIFGPLGAIAGAKAGKAVADLVVNKLGKTTAEQLAATSKVVDAFTRGTSTGARVAVPLATKTLSSVRFGAEQPDAGKGVSGSLATSFRKRVAEIDRLTAFDETGTPRMRPDARAQITNALAPIRHVAPVAADRMETVAARRIETYAAMKPRKPDVGGLMGGPDRWQPSDSAMRGWARVIAVGENPLGFERRVTAGRITPEEAEAYRRIYPERFAHLRDSITAQLPSLQKALPYSRRLTLSMLTGAPVDPAMHPAVLTVLQGLFRAEPGSNSGTMAPKPTPQFGSVKRQEPTPGERRAQGTR